MTSPESLDPPPWEPPPGAEDAETRGLVVCPVCLTRVAAKARKCPNCGEPLRKRAAARRRRMGCQLLMLALACCLGLSAYALLRYGASVSERQARERQLQEARQERMAWSAAESITIGRNTTGCRRAEDLARSGGVPAPDCMTLPVGAAARPVERDPATGALRVRLAGTEDLWWIEAQRPATDNRRPTP